MACFVVPVAEAVAVTVVAQVIARKEKKKLSLSTAGMNISSQKIANTQDSGKICFSRKLMWLSKLLWGGSLLLAFEHLWHGEVVAWFPFLTAASNPEDTVEMLHEMATVGVSMAVLVTAVWGVLAIVSDLVVNRTVKPETADHLS